MTGTCDVFNFAHIEGFQLDIAAAITFAHLFDLALVIDAGELTNYFLGDIATDILFVIRRVSFFALLHLLHFFFRQRSTCRPAQFTVQHTRFWLEGEVCEI